MNNSLKKHLRRFGTLIYFTYLCVTLIETFVLPSQKYLNCLMVVITQDDWQDRFGFFLFVKYWNVNIFIIFAYLNEKRAYS